MSCARSRLVLLLATTVAALAPVTPAAADEVRRAGACGAGASASLRLKEDDGRIELRFELRHGRGSARWHVVVVQERRVAWRGDMRARDGRVRLRRRLVDLPGVDRITVTASGPRGLRCSASATLSG